MNVIIVDLMLLPESLIHIKINSGIFTFTLIKFKIVYNRGRCKQSISDFKSALDDYNKAYELEPHRENDQRYLLKAMKNNGLMDMFDKDLEQ